MSIFKKIRKGIKKIGSSVAKRMRKIGRGVKKGFSKLTKAFGKLGPLGHLALFFILPGMGNVLTGWMGQFGTKVMNMLPKNFASVIGNVGTKIKSAATFAYDNTIGAVYNTVSKALTAGIDAVTAPFMGGQGAATRFQNFVANTAKKLGPQETPLTTEQIAEAQREVTAQAKESFSDLEKTIDSGAELPAGRTEQLRQEQARQRKITAEARASSEKVLGKPADTTIKVDTKGKVADVSAPKEKGFFGRQYDKYTQFKSDVAGKEVLGSGITVGETASVAKDATGVFTAYKHFNPDEVQGSFYNPNIGMANALNAPNDPYTLSSMASNFVSVADQPQTLNQSASIYSNAMGINDPDPIFASLNAPGYGLSFEDYVTAGGNYG